MAKAPTSVLFPQKATACRKELILSCSSLLKVHMPLVDQLLQMGESIRVPKSSSKAISDPRLEGGKQAGVLLYPYFTSIMPPKGVGGKKT